MDRISVVARGSVYPSKPGQCDYQTTTVDDVKEQAWQAKHVTDLQHHVMLLLAGNNFFRAPLSNPQSILDVGTGTDLWAIDFAEQFPAASVIGTDISPIQPPWVPPNCRFELDDATKESSFRDGQFDFVHMRYMTGSIPDWVDVYKQAYRCLKPGGWIEYSDFSIETVL